MAYTLYEDLAKILSRGTLNFEGKSVPGTWGPNTGILGYLNPFSRDYAATELARDIMKKRPSAEVTTRFNNPAVIREVMGSTAPVSPSSTTKTTQTPTDRGTPSGGDNGVPGGDNGVQSQDDYMQQIINTMKASLSAIRDMIASQIERAKQIKEDSDKYISGRYDLLKGDVGTKAQQMLNELGKEREQVRSQYAQGEGQTARSYEDASLKNRMLARAMGLGPSSYYLQSQMDTREKGLDKLAKLAQERASKFSGISQRETGVTDWKTKMETQIDLEKQKMLDANDSWLKDQIAKANFDEKILGINSYDQLAKALREYQANKDAIERYNASRLSELYSTVGQREGIYKSDISSQQAIDNNLAQILAQISGLTNAKTPISPTIGSVVSEQAPTSAYPIIDKKKKQYENPFEEYIYGLPANV